MKSYIQFFTTDLAHNVVEALGSDSILPIDGRVNNRQKIHALAITRNNSLSRIGKSYVAYEFRRGNIRNYRTIYKQTL